MTEKTIIFEGKTPIKKAFKTLDKERVTELKRIMFADDGSIHITYDSEPRY